MGFEWSASDQLLDEMVHWTQWATPADPYGVLTSVYLMGGPLVQGQSLESAAYGPRGAKWVLHYKHQWSPQDGQAKMEEMVDHHANLSRALDKHLNCSHFYNYMGSDLTCADTNDKWLAAHFSNVPRMKTIKAANDPLDTFRSRLAGHRAASTIAISTKGTSSTTRSSTSATNSTPASSTTRTRNTSASANATASYTTGASSTTRSSTSAPSNISAFSTSGVAAAPAHPATFLPSARP